MRVKVDLGAERLLLEAQAASPLDDDESYASDSTYVSSNCRQMLTLVEYRRQYMQASASEPVLITQRREGGRDLPQLLPALDTGKKARAPWGAAAPKPQSRQESRQRSRQRPQTSAAERNKRLRAKRRRETEAKRKTLVGRKTVLAEEAARRMFPAARDASARVEERR
eukprot:CAMPEP_0119269654 /NCGR_PEP_ID=MMETSP1329-20130426/6978_1 /TAXON_ID=114041 /ORGANISM="Genus nov. species nov., Strain RCC1024" /LENGTH=167 /DNA_ID=CAMNT_0007269655 /DNA_START=178 /DNA_END=677 /DNA_ORIENTATION=-